MEKGNPANSPWITLPDQHNSEHPELCLCDKCLEEAGKYSDSLIHAAAAALGARGGASKSPAKQVASRENGKLGGRPKMMRDVINELEVAITANEFDERDMKSNHPTPGSR